MKTSEGFEIRVRSPKSVDAAFAIVTKDFDPADPEVAIHLEERAVVYDTQDGVHRVQGVIEVEADPAGRGSLVTYGLAINFGGVLGRIGPIRRRMAAMMRRGVTEELEADLDGERVD